MLHTEHCITIEAPVQVVYDILADVVGYATLFPPTRSVEILEEDTGYQIARLEVDVGGQLQTWTSRRNLVADRRIISYQQIQKAPLLKHMSGEWRCFPLTEQRTQLVLTHDFEVREPTEGKVIGQYTPEEAEAIVCDAVERNSRADLAAVKKEAERRAAPVRPGVTYETLD